jgi:hypothetical protein
MDIRPLNYFLDIGETYPKISGKIRPSKNFPDGPGIVSRYFRKFFIINLFQQYMELSLK